MEKKRTSILVISAGALLIGLLLTKGLMGKHDVVKETASVQPKQKMHGASSRDALSPMAAERPSTDSPPSATNATKSVERFEVAQKCAFSYRAKETIDAQLKVCESNESYRGSPEHADFFASCDRRIAEFEPRLANLKRALSACEGENSTQAEEAFFRATDAAAKEGHPDAQLCYVRGTFFLGRPWTESEKFDYQRNAMRYIADAQRRGDWRFVELLRQATPEVIGQSGLIGAITRGDRESIYRYNRLLRLGASSAKYQEFLDNLAVDPGAPLSPQVVRAADAWAKETYNAHYRRIPLAAQPESCIAFPEDAGPRH